MKIMFVCHGNICRSPMAQAIFEKLASQAGLDVVVDSAATSREELGNAVYPPAQRTLQRHGITGFTHHARQFTKTDYLNFDIIKVMDHYNFSNLLRIIGNVSQNKVSLLLGRDISDPWFTGDFERTYQDLYEGCQKLLTHLLEQHD
jgi:protein-tyrosine phosphatase